MRQGNISFSIIIPTLNEEKFLPGLLADLKRQNERDFEVIIVDGGSADDTKKVAQKYETFFNLSILDSKKKNVSYQRNLGAKKAVGLYLIFLDADSRVGSSLVKKLKKIITKNKYLILIPSVEPQEKTYQYEIIFKSINFFVEMSQAISKPFSSGGSMIIQRDFFNLIGGFNEKLFIAEDHEIVRRARGFGVTAKMLRDVHIKLSLRRMQKEGRLDVFRKYLIASIHTLTRGEIDKEIFSYDMGGAQYKFTRTNSKSLDKTLKSYYKKFKKQVEEFINE